MTQNAVAAQTTYPQAGSTGPVTSYKNILSAAIPLTTLYNAPGQPYLPASIAFQINYIPLYRLTAWVWLTGQSSNGHQIGPLTISWTDPNGNAQSTTIGFSKATQRSVLTGEGGTFGIGSNAAASDSLFAGTLPLVVKPGTKIQFQMPYSSTQTPNAQYAIALVLEQF